MTPPFDHIKIVLNIFWLAHGANRAKIQVNLLEPGVTSPSKSSILRVAYFTIALLVINFNLII